MTTLTRSQKTRSKTPAKHASEDATASAAARGQVSSSGRLHKKMRVKKVARFKQSKGARGGARGQVAERPSSGIITSRITARNQTTLPSGVRDVLALKPGQRLGYVIDESGVRLVNTEAQHEDPIVQQFLRLLAQSIGAGELVPFSEELLARARALTVGVPIDHDAPLDGAIDL